ncbi:MAG: response regulator transcription factor [Chloroflexi bacterium]|nr:response regulator transcription factor [Chloroflexota bacterium]OJV99064.1 MAG: DNA-binding response regulator [Chloroflexi bacterium 54-19]
MTKILVVDDEKKLVDLVKGYLEQEGYSVLSAFDGPSALEKARTANPELVVLDLMLPGLDGVEVCRRLRQFSDAYVIMLTARAEEIDKIVGLSVGADDYLTKPFSPRELVARIKARLRRPRTGSASESPSEAALPRHFGELIIDETQHEVSRNGEVLPLTTREFALLAILSSQPGRVFTRSQLLEQVWGEDYYDEHIIEVHIGNLRKKLGEGPNQTGFIETIRGLGYRFDKRYAL